LFATLNHLLRVHPDFFHFLQNGHRLAVRVERFARPLHRLILGTLSDYATELARFLFKHCFSVQLLQP
jgi:hypothetical protein